MRSRALTIVPLVAVLAAGCGAAGGASKELRDAVATLEAAQKTARAYTYVDEALDGSQKIGVDGRAQDDFRYEGTVSVDGKERYQMVVSDDAVALRLIDTGALNNVIEVARTVDPQTAEALAAGRWVVDHTGAPALQVRAPAPQEGRDGEQQPSTLSQRRQTQIPDDPFFDAADVIHYAERAVRGAIGVGRFNPDSIEYNPADDPWKADGDKELDDQGIIRYDISQLPLPQRAERGQQQRLPNVGHFRKMAVYTKAEHAFEIREQVSLVDRREFRRAEEGRSSKYYTQLRDAALRGGISDRLRERLMTFKLRDAREVTVDLPQDAVDGLLTEVIGPRGLKQLFDFKMIGGGGGVVAPGAGLPTSAPSPTSQPVSTG